MHNAFFRVPIGEFSIDWQETTLADVCLQVTDGTHDFPA